MENVNSVDEQQSPSMNGNSKTITRKVLQETKIAYVKFGEIMFNTNVLAYVPDLNEVESVELHEARLAIQKQRVSYKLCVEKALNKLRECIEHSRSILQSMEKKSEREDITSVSTSNPPKRRKVSLADLIPFSNKIMKK